VKNTFQSRRLILMVALAATVAAVGWVGGQEEMATTQVSRQADPAPDAAKTAAPPPETSTIEIGKLQQRQLTRDFADIFQSHSWQPPPPPPAKPAPPRAPPLPFTFFGRMVEDGKTVVFLSRQDQIFTAKTGDTIAGQYRVEEIGPATMVLTYLPLQERQVLNIGAIN